MTAYRSEPTAWLESEGRRIASFTGISGSNADASTVESFGDEWTKFSGFDANELRIAGDQYFDIVRDEMLGADKNALDIGCGTGRWSRYLSPRIGTIEAIDPSEAVFAASKFTADCKNIRITQAGYGGIPFAENSFDFVFSLGVVHHLPDTEGAIREAAAMVKSGGHLLLYIYYSLDNRGFLYRLLFGMSALVRRIISSFPRGLKFFCCDLMAVFVYMPFVLLARFFRMFSAEGKFWKKIPLSYYADKSWKIIRNDSLDRFGTPLEKRFSKKEIEAFLLKSGMKNITFSDKAPYWHVIAQK